MKKILTLLLITWGLSASAQGQNSGTSTLVNPMGPVQMTNVVIPSQTSRASSNYFVINLRNSCFRTDLQPVQNPLGPDSQIRFSFVLRTSTGPVNVSVTYSGKTAIVQNGTTGLASQQTPTRIPASVRAGSFGNMVRIEVPITAVATVDSNGEINEAVVPVMEDLTFFQIVPANSMLGTFIARTGDLSATVHVLQPNGSFSAEVHAAFPGQKEYCGGS